MKVLEVHNLSKHYPTGKKVFQAVKDISFHLEQGETLGFLGPNGAGKTTTIQMLLGTLTPSAGQITYFGLDFAAHREASLARIGTASAYTRLPAQLSVEECLEVQGLLYSMPKALRKERIEYCIERFVMKDLRKKIFGSLSAGQMTRCILAKAFLPLPDLVLLDEPTASLDPDIAAEVRHFIAEERSVRKVSFLFTSHNLREVEMLCSRVIFLLSGEIVVEGKPSELRLDSERKEVWMNVQGEQAEHALHQLAAKFSCTLQKREKGEFVAHMKKSEILPFLSALHQEGIPLHDVKLIEGDLEEYFLELARKQKEELCIQQAV